MEAPTPVSALLHAATRSLKIINIILTRFFYNRSFQNNSYNKSVYSPLKREVDNFIPYPEGEENNFIWNKCFKLNNQILQLTAFR
jgi:hypothetical protein